jgi:hypothetical protein
VTNIQSKVIGVVTDRDMFIALATLRFSRNFKPAKKSQVE